MKRKGFTLIELLAVIVILAVIALITIPLIGNIIEDSRKEALEQSVNGIIEAANYFTISNDGDYHFVFSNEKKGVAPTGEKLDYKGEIDATGDLYIDEEGNISLCFMNSNNYIYKNYNSGIYIGEVSNDTCIVGYDAITNKYIAMLDDGSGTVSNVYSKDDVDDLVTNLQEQITSNKNNIEVMTSQVNTNTSDIANIQSDIDIINTALRTPTQVNFRQSFSSTTDLTYTGISVTIPANKFYTITGIAWFSYTEPTAIGLASSDTIFGYNYLCSSSSQQTHMSCTTSGYSGSAGITIYAWASYAVAATNNITLSGYYF